MAVGWLAVLGCSSTPSTVGTVRDAGGERSDGGRSDAAPSPDATPAVPDASVEAGSDGGGDGGEPPPECEKPPNPVDPGFATLAPEFEPFYEAFDLGWPQGVPSPLGGVVVSKDDPDVLLVAGLSERASGGIYAIRVRRGPCGHILGFDGEAEWVVGAPWVDANLVYGEGGVLLFTMYPSRQVGQWRPGAASVEGIIDLEALGLAPQPVSGGGGPGGMGFVPPPIGSGESLRLLSYPDGKWYRLDVRLRDGLYEGTALTEVRDLPDGPGGFAYVPAGSPGFPQQALIVTEWEWDTTDDIGNSLGAYDVDERGDPLPESRRDFFSYFQRPWGAYFDRVSGDLIFITWTADSATNADRIVVVQGFVPPPELF